MRSPNHGRCHFGSLSGVPAQHCTRAATKKWGDHWFCSEHGWRSPAARKFVGEPSEADKALIRKCVTRLPEEPSCPSCERTREIIVSRINAAQCNQKWEVLDALKEIQEALNKQTP